LQTGRVSALSVSSGVMTTSMVAESPSFNRRTLELSVSSGPSRPSSRLIRFTSMPAWAPIVLPVRVSPVKEISSTFLLR